MKILLGSLFFPREEGPGEHLGLAYLAALLREAGHEVEILDTLLMDLNFEETLRFLTSHSFDLLGISTFERGMEPLQHLLEQLRAAGVTTPVVLGGHFASFRCVELLTLWKSVDAICLGEGELPLRLLVDRLDQPRRWREIPGLAGRDGAGLYINPPASGAVLSKLPFPVRDTLPAVLNLKGRASLSSSRGCYGRCAFCSIAAFYRLAPGPIWRARPPLHVVNEMSEVALRWAPAAFEFVDDNFMGVGQEGGSRARTIAEELLRRGLTTPFSFACRADNVEAGLFRYLQRAGLDEVFLGVESGAPEALRRYDKRSTVEQAVRALAVLLHVGVRPRLGFIMFDPYTTLEQLAQNLIFLKAENRYRWLAAPDLLHSRLIAFSGTPMANRLQQEGNIRWNGLHPVYHFYDVGTAWVYRQVELWMEAGQVFESRLRILKWRWRMGMGDARFWRSLESLEGRYMEALLAFLDESVARGRSKQLVPEIGALQRTREILLAPLWAALDQIEAVGSNRIGPINRSPA